MNRKKAFEILEITSQNPTDTDIKKAYRKLSMKHHPDRNQAQQNLLKFSRMLIMLILI